MASHTRQSLKFVPATSQQIQIDLDIPIYKFGLVRFSQSKSGNLHIAITMPHSLGIKQRIILAAALGDDPIRARLNMRRARLGDPYPVLFLEERK